MRIFPLLLIAFFLIPLVEIFALINVGQVIGAWWTIAAVVGTAVLGAFLIRAQGVSTLSRAQSQMAEGRVPAVEMFEGLFLFIAGALLMTPGFVTDAIGFACLIPPLRRLLIRAGIKRGVVRSMGGVTAAGGFGGGPHGHGQDAGSGRSSDGTEGRTIESDYRRVDPADPDQPKSGH